MTTVFSIGYECAALSDFVATLKEAGVEHLLDVRELAQSRRPGFSKKALSEALASAGIGYSHCKQLGDPKHGREAARRGDMELFRQIFDAHLDLPASQRALKEASELVTSKPTALMCYERDNRQCHRSRVADRLLSLGAARIQHLGVRVYGRKSEVRNQEASRHA